MDLYGFDKEKLDMRQNWPLGHTRFAELVKEIETICDKVNGPIKSSKEFTIEYVERLNLDLQCHFRSYLGAFDTMPKENEVPICGFLGDWRFMAQASLDNKNRPNYTIGNGLMLAFDDLFLKMCCIKPFFSFEPIDGSDRWYVDFSRFGCVRPIQRYLDYSQVIDRELYKKNCIAPNERINQSYCSVFFEAVPCLKRERFELAATMTGIALAWIIQHEKSHYDLGHLHYLKMNPAANNNPRLRAHIELEADKNATMAIARLLESKGFIRIPSVKCK
jgi:hypothetical protein